MMELFALLSSCLALGVGGVCGQVVDDRRCHTGSEDDTATDDSYAITRDGFGPSLVIAYD